MQTEATNHKKNNKPFIAIILAAVVLGLGFALYLALNPVLSTDNAMVERPKATLSTKMMGLISSITVKEGDLVTKGQLLASLDDAELKAQKKQAEANLIVVRQSIRLSQLTLDRSNGDLERATRQYKNQIISTEAYDHAVKNAESAQQDFVLSSKKVEIAEAQVELINATLKSAQIKAPIDGVVAKKWMNEGDLLSPGLPVVTIYDSHTATVTANFDETKISKIKVGQAVTFKVDAFPHVTFHGKVMEIGYSTGNQFSLIPVNNAAGNFTKIAQRIPVKISIDESTDLQDPNSYRLLAGFSAVVEIHL
jgi:membrane fusion protein (multidrug efflux system)